MGDGQIDNNLTHAIGPAPPSRPAIEVDGVGLRDRTNQSWLIGDIRLVVNLGDRVGLMGPSGAGKTLLLRAIGLLEPLDQGSIRWQGRAVRGECVPVYRKQVMYVHQRPALWDGTVEDNLLVPYTLKTHASQSFDRERVVDLFRALGREASFLQKSARDLSGGEAQMVALIRAIQLDPLVLLLDEPTASLDPATAQGVEGMLDRWQRAAGSERAWIWVSHDANQTRRMTTRRLNLRAGRLASEC